MTTTNKTGRKDDRMENAIREEFISGFCKLQNQTRMVICELEEHADGRREILSSDCAYGDCPHSRDCRLMGQIYDIV